MKNCGFFIAILCSLILVLFFEYLSSDIDYRVEQSIEFTEMAGFVEITTKTVQINGFGMRTLGPYINTVLVKEAAVDSCLSAEEYKALKKIEGFKED